MGQWWGLVLTLLYSVSVVAASQHARKALYPSASRVKRGTYSLVNPTFHTSVDDVKLLFEILLAGLQVEGENRRMLIPDAELASLRRVNKLEVICEDILPKSLPEVRRLTSLLSQQRGHLSRQDFERTLLTMVYTAQTRAKAVSAHQKALWNDALLLLFKAIKRDLEPP
ncbi:protein FAM180A [Osmerus mordax]|uniref:protein FAM180A n=1 Tax=Osmerus mordax TaxID=8014 RepID=UPI00350F5255